MKILIVIADFYQDITADLLSGAKAALDKAKAEYDVVNVPGALEIPAAIAFASEAAEYDGYIALGCVIRGETYHFEVVSNESARGLMDLAIGYDLAIGNGILTCENKVQAITRAKIDEKNKGGEAAKTALTMIGLKNKL